jgi:autonomous glycyl radical cofactor GrcA
MCDLSLDVTPEDGGFDYRITDLRKKTLVQVEGGQYLSVENAKLKAERDARHYAGGYAGPIKWTPIRFSNA